MANRAVDAVMGPRQTEVRPMMSLRPLQVVHRTEGPTAPVASAGSNCQAGLFSAWIHAAGSLPIWQNVSSSRCRMIS